MKANEIFKTLINILRSESLRTEMEFKPSSAKKQIITELSSTELKFVGAGIYSVVVEHDAHPGRVFKVSTSRWDGYREYAKYCIEHVGEPLIPIVYSAEEKGNFSWYELEKYYPVTKAKLSKSGMVQYTTDAIRNMVKIASDAQYPYNIDDNYLKLNTKPVGSYPRTRKEHLRELKEIYSTTKVILDTFRKRFTLDLHCGNIMQTVDEKIIITDPLAANAKREIPVTEPDPVDEDFV